MADIAPGWKVCKECRQCGFGFLPGKTGGSYAKTFNVYALQIFLFSCSSGQWIWGRYF